MSATLVDQIGVVQLAPGEFETKLLPFRMGNPLPVAYGGCTVAAAVSAACATVAPSFSLYSVVGHFHGPSSTQRKLRCSVQSTRDTRSFATRRVQVKQEQADGSFRTSLELIADFHVREAAAMDYARGPLRAWPGPEESRPTYEAAEALREQGVVTARQVKEYAAALGPSEDFFEARYCGDGVMAQNLSGVAKHATTTQDQLPITDKLSAEWVRSRSALPTTADNMAALAFLMDGQLSFLPLSHSHQWFDDVAAVSSLDFALRVLTPDVDMRGWHLRESRTLHGGHGRTFSEAWLWNEKGEAVATVSQQSIMRAVKKKEKTKL
jgi:acyl-CoA thioesterase II